MTRNLHVGLPFSGALLPVLCTLLFAACGGGGLAGSTFEAKAEEGGGRLVIQFTDGQTVKIGVLAPGAPDGIGAAVGTYKTSGDQVIVSVQGDPETFTLKGNTLVGTFGGEQVTFKRK